MDDVESQHCKQKRTPGIPAVRPANYASFAKKYQGLHRVVRAHHVHRLSQAIILRLLNQTPIKKEYQLMVSALLALKTPSKGFQLHSKPTINIYSHPLLKGVWSQLHHIKLEFSCPWTRTSQRDVPWSLLAC